MTERRVGSAATGWRESVWSLWRKCGQWLVILGLAGVALVLGSVGFWRHFASRGEPRSLLDIFYLTVQLFMLESGGVSGPLPWQLELARFLAPMVAAWTVVKGLAVIFREQFQMLRLARTSDHVVVCGLGRKGLQLVKDFRRRGDEVVVIELDDGNDRIRSCQDLGALVLLGNATDKSLLRKARVHCAKHVVAICGDDGTNVETAVSTYQLVRERGANVEGVVLCFVQIMDLRLCTLFKQHRVFTETDDPFEARVFSIYENSARLLFDKYPLDRTRITVGDSRVVHLVLVGFGQMAESVLLQAARTGHYASGRRLRVTVVDAQAEERKKGLYGRYPQLDKVCDVAFLSGGAEDPDVLEAIRQWAGEEGTLTTVVICLDGDPRSLSCGLSVLWKLKDRPVPILLRMSDDAGMSVLLEGEEGGLPWATHLRAFGMTSVTCTRRMLLNEELDTVAKAIHEHFVAERRKEGRPETDPSMRPWARLDPDLKDSNRQQADHIPVKLRAIGCCSSRPMADRPPVTDFSDEEVALLARMEHARWNAERWLAGWALGPRDNEKKTNPYLVPWEELPDEIKEYDLQAVNDIPRFLEMIGEEIYRCSDTQAEVWGEDD